MMRTSGPLDREMESLESIVRWKNEQKMRLAPEEAAFFARMPADKRNARVRREVELRGAGR